MQLCVFLLFFSFFSGVCPRDVRIARAILSKVSLFEQSFVGSLAHQ